MSIEDILDRYKGGDLTLDEAVAGLQATYFEDLGHTVVDHNRQLRTGAGEVIYGAGKSAEQIADIAMAMLRAGTNVLVTRLDPDKHGKIASALAQAVPDAVGTYHPASRLLTYIPNAVPRLPHPVAVVSAGTSDHAVAEEAAVTAEFFGNDIIRISDVGVAGLHRLLARLDDLRRARVLVVVAGMEGALPSVIGGLVDKPVIAVPTSVGYGAAFDGMTALMGMMTSCASGVSVVNIDNGFGAGYLANSINRL